MWPSNVQYSATCCVLNVVAATPTAVPKTVAAMAPLEKATAVNVDAPAAAPTPTVVAPQIAPASGSAGSAASTTAAVAGAAPCITAPLVTLHTL